MPGLNEMFHLSGQHLINSRSADGDAVMSVGWSSVQHNADHLQGEEKVFLSIGEVIYVYGEQNWALKPSTLS